MKLSGCVLVITRQESIGDSLPEEGSCVLSGAC